MGPIALSSGWKLGMQDKSNYLNFNVWIVFLLLPDSVVKMMTILSASNFAWTVGRVDG